MLFQGKQLLRVVSHDRVGLLVIQLPLSHAAFISSPSCSSCNVTKKKKNPFEKLFDSPVRLGKSSLFGLSSVLYLRWIEVVYTCLRKSHTTPKITRTALRGRGRVRVARWGCSKTLGMHRQCKVALLWVPMFSGHQVRSSVVQEQTQLQAQIAFHEQGHVLSFLTFPALAGKPGPEHLADLSNQPMIHGASKTTNAWAHSTYAWTHQQTPAHFHGHANRGSRDPKIATLLAHGPRHWVPTLVCINPEDLGGGPVSTRASQRQSLTRLYKVTDTPQLHKHRTSQNQAQVTY